MAEQGDPGQGRARRRLHHVALEGILIANASAGSISITITNGQYSINGGAYTSAAGTIHSGDTLTIQTTSSCSYNTRVLAGYSIGNQSGAFQVTTKSGP